MEGLRRTCSPRREISGVQQPETAFGVRQKNKIRVIVNERLKNSFSSLPEKVRLTKMNPAWQRTIMEGITEHVFGRLFRFTSQSPERQRLSARSNQTPSPP